MKKYPSHTLFEITEAESADQRPTFTPIGCAFTNADGSLNILIDDGKALNPAKRHQLRQRKAKAAGKGGAA